MSGRLGADLTPGGYVLGVGGSMTGTMPAPFVTPGGVIAVQPGIGDTPATIAPSVTGYGATPGAAQGGALPGAAQGGALSSLTTFQEILIVLGIVAAMIIIPSLEKK